MTRLFREFRDAEATTRRCLDRLPRGHELHGNVLAQLRRCERLMVELNDQPGESVTPEALKYVNRLSDFLFVAGRFANQKGNSDVLWVPGQNR